LVCNLERIGYEYLPTLKGFFLVSIGMLMSVPLKREALVMEASDILYKRVSLLPNGDHIYNGNVVI
jgi:hypothetical protein